MKERQKYIDDLVIKVVDDYVFDYVDDNEKFHTKEHQRRVTQDRIYNTIKISKNDCEKYTTEIIFIKRFIDFLSVNNINNVSLLKKVDLSDIDKINEKLNKLDLGFTINCKFLIEAIDIVNKFICKDYENNFENYPEYKQFLQNIMTIYPFKSFDFSLYAVCILETLLILEIYKIKMGIRIDTYLNDWF
ncbi:MAG: hypothetical protein FWC41_13945, partial [Firmicutes bacterium]|nr:hypothetical protein [Bacillota bacterium]